MEAFCKEILRQIESRQMLTEGERWLLAVSGGADSMAMLAALAELWKGGELRAGGLHVAHLNHGLRGRESELDAEFVQQEAQRLELPCMVEAVNGKAAAREKKLSLETAARMCRYEFLVRTARNRRCEKLVLAHNADDNAETVLHRILRGTGIRGLAGIPAVRRMGGEPPVTLIRPLLSVRRPAIDVFLQEHDIPYRLDRSNREPFCTRNRIRLELLPQLREQYNPNIDAALIRLADIVGMVQSLSEDAAETLTRITVERTDRSLRMDRDKFCAEPRWQQTEILHQALRRLGAGLQRIGYRQIQAILEAIRGEKGGEGSINLPDGLSVRYDVYSLCLVRGKAGASGESLSERASAVCIAVSIPGTTVLNPAAEVFDPHAGGAAVIRTITTEVLEAGPESLSSFLRVKSPREEMLDLDAVEGELVLRTREVKDRFYPLGSPGEKTLGDFFTDHKIPLSLRDRIVLLSDSKNILYVPAVRISQQARVTPQTRRILHVRWD